LLRIYLMTAPEEIRHAQQHRLPLAYTGYRIGAGSALMRQNVILSSPQGGILCISDQNAPFIDDPDALCAAAIRECDRRNYDGVLLNFFAPPSQDRLTFAARLARALAVSSRRLYAPEEYAAAIPDAIVLLGTALSGGTLEEHLQEAAERWGCERLALTAERTRMQFSLPCPSGIGTHLRAAELRQLTERESPSVFFSPELCARYFTYCENGKTQFVLFDDAGTLKEKLRLGQQFGLSTAFFDWAEVCDIAKELFA